MAIVGFGACEGGLGAVASSRRANSNTHASTHHGLGGFVCLQFRKRSGWSSQ